MSKSLHTLERGWSVPGFVFIPAGQLPSKIVPLAYQSVVGCTFLEFQKVLYGVRSLDKIDLAGRVQTDSPELVDSISTWFQSKGALNLYRQELPEVMKARLGNMQYLNPDGLIVSVLRPVDPAQELLACRREAVISAVKARGYDFVPRS